MSGCRRRKSDEEQVKELLAQAEAADAEEDARYGKDRAGDELPEELQRRETRLKRIKEAKRALEERAREKAKRRKARTRSRPHPKPRISTTLPIPSRGS